jgi:hypothetical protein
LSYLRELCRYWADATTGGRPSSGSMAFHLVCPSLPGYGFSDKPTRPGWGAERIANA